MVDDDGPDRDESPRVEPADAILATLAAFASAKEEVSTLQAQLTVAVQVLLDALSTAIAPLETAVSAIQKDQEIILANFRLPDEQKTWLLSVAAQMNQTPGDLMASIISERMSWHPDSFLVLFPGSEDITRQVLGLGKGRSLRPDQVVRTAIQFAWDNRYL